MWVNICTYGMLNREAKEGFTKFLFIQMLHSLTTLCTHYACVCADKLLTFHISLFQNLKHMNSNKKPSLVNFLWINICKYGMPNRESKEGFKKFILFQMADALFISTICTHALCTCFCGYIMNFCISLFKKLRPLYSN